MKQYVQGKIKWLKIYGMSREYLIRGGNYWMLLICEPITI